MNKLIIYITFFLWLIYFLSICSNAMKIKIKKVNNYKKWLIKNYKKYFNIPSIILLILYIIFSLFNNSIVNILLFFTIILYLYVNFLNDNKNTSKSFNNIDNPKFFYIIFIFVLILPFEYYFLYNNLKIIYLWLLIYNFLAYYLVVAIKYIALFINNKK